MGKFKKEFVTAVKEEQKKEAEQKKLHEKHRVEDENILVVERDNMVKFLIRNSARLIRILATVSLFILATIGLIALVYPEIRTELLLVLQKIFREGKGMLNL